MTDAQKLAKIRRIFETVRAVKGDERAQVSTHAAYNLEGAIISIEHDAGRCERSTMRTLRRVCKQLYDIGAVIGAKN